MYVVSTNVSLKRKMRTDRTTRLLIVILSLFLISEFPQVVSTAVVEIKISYQSLRTIKSFCARFSQPLKMFFINFSLENICLGWAIHGATSSLPHVLTFLHSNLLLSLLCKYYPDKEVSFNWVKQTPSAVSDRFSSFLDPATW